MKAALFALALILPATSAFAERVPFIPAGDAPYYVGADATVYGLASIQKMRSGEVYLDLDGRSDGAPLSAYVSRWNRPRFGDLSALDGKLIAISGPIGAFRYRPEIFLTHQDQIAVATPEEQVETRPQPRWIHISTGPTVHYGAYSGHHGARVYGPP